MYIHKYSMLQCTYVQYIVENAAIPRNYTV